MHVNVLDQMQELALETFNLFCQECRHFNIAVQCKHWKQ